MTTHSWDENPTGQWTLEIENVAGASDYGKASVLCVWGIKNHNQLIIVVLDKLLFSFR